MYQLVIDTDMFDKLYIGSNIDVYNFMSLDKLKLFVKDYIKTNSDNVYDKDDWDMDDYKLFMDEINKDIDNADLNIYDPFCYSLCYQHANYSSIKMNDDYISDDYIGIGITELRFTDADVPREMNGALHIAFCDAIKRVKQLTVFS